VNAPKVGINEVLMQLFTIFYIGIYKEVFNSLNASKNHFTTNIVKNITITIAHTVLVAIFVILID
jgi:hypothetical protein